MFKKKCYKESSHNCLANDISPIRQDIFNQTFTDKDCARTLAVAEFSQRRILLAVFI